MDKLIIRVQKPPINWSWILKMAWRDGRRNKSRLVLFISSIILGIAALVAINSFSDNLLNNIDNQAKELLGSDFEIVSSQEPEKDIIAQIKSAKNTEHSHQVSFASMVYFPKSKGTRLVQVRALEGAFPFYGKIETTPKEAANSFKNDRKAIVDQALLLQFDAQVGDSIRIGKQSFFIEGSIEKVPGQAGIVGTAAPPIFIPHRYLEETGLIQKGSRLQYRNYFKFASTKEAEDKAEEMSEALKDKGYGFETVASRKENLGNAFSNLNKFLNLVAFVALLLGCVGVASSVNIYAKEKITSIAILRCLGATGAQAFAIFLSQIVIIGLFGSILGAILGSAIQSVLPIILGDFLPLDISFAISWRAVIFGILIGAIISFLFAVLPLLNIRLTSPMLTLRASFEPSKKRDPWKIAVYLATLLFIFGFIQYQGFGDWKSSIGLTLGVILTFAILAGLAQVVMFSIKKFFPSSWSYIGRQGLANLFRPNNQTATLIISIGLGTALMCTLYMVQGLLIEQVTRSGSGEQANMVLFDIQTSQKEKIAELTRAHQLPVLSEVPIVTMRLEKINDLVKKDYEKDTTDESLPKWVFNREYRVTYRDSLIDSEKLTEGVLDRFNGDTIYVSIAERFAKNTKVKLGDGLTFNVQGALLKVYVGSVRKVDWNRVQTNFWVLFPTGILESAPQFHVLMTRVPDPKSSAAFQSDLVQKYPNISLIDLDLILKTVDDILSKVAFVIEFMALFSILTGLIVLISSVMISKFQRVKESVLLRTLGASKKQIIRITTLEYFLLGAIASLTGIVLALIGSWALAKFTFDLAFIPALLPILIIFSSITLITVLIGILNSREVLNKPPLEVLRNEL